MANITFRPNKGKEITDPDKQQFIYIRYRLGRKVDFNASIKATVFITDWDKQKEQVKNRTQILNRIEINNLISKLRTYFEKFENTNISNGKTPTYQEVKNYYLLFFDMPNQDSKPTLLEYFDAFINRPENLRTLKTGTIKSYGLTKNFLTRFYNEHRRFDFDNIDLEWYNDFLEWCEHQNLKPNYIGKHIKVLKSVMNDAFTNEITTNIKFKHKKFIILKEDVESIYLNDVELQKLNNLDLRTSPSHDKARDLFLIGAYTGLRVSDYNNLTDKNIITIKGQTIFKVQTEKTKKVVAIPLHPNVRSILRKYNGLPPSKVSDQKINQLIKDVAEWAGIDEVVITASTIGGKKVTTKNYKFELVKTHTGRRSFCTNAYLIGMATLDIMTISGHTSEKTFLNYIKATPEEKALKIASHAFFNPILKAV